MESEGYMSFLVRLWRDSPGTAQTCDWCGELEQIQTGARWSFSTYGELLACLHQLTGASQAVTAHAEAIGDLTIDTIAT
jgi:hypothetical protein